MTEFFKGNHTQVIFRHCFTGGQACLKKTFILQLTENKSTNMFIHANVVFINDKIFRLTSLAAVMQWSWMVVRDVSTSS